MQQGFYTNSHLLVRYYLSITSANEKNKKSEQISPVIQVFSHQAMKYKRGSFDFAANSNLVIDMLLNNMKIEG